MKILHVGDMAGVAFKLVDILGTEASLVCCDNLDRWQSPRALRIPYHSTASNLRVLAKVLTTQADVLHGHALMSILLPFCGRPYVCHVHGSDAHEVATADTWRGKMLRYAWRRASRVFCVTPDLLSIVKNSGVSEDCITHLPNPVNENLFKCHRPVENMGNINVLYPSRPSDNRRHFDTFLQGWMRVAEDQPRMYLYLIRHANDLAGIERTVTIVQQSGLGHQIIVHDLVSNAEMVWLYNDMDIVADWFNPQVPAISQALIEAMMCERLVISAIHNLPYWKAAPICPGGTVNEIEDSLRGLIALRPDWSKLAQKSRSWSIGKHGYDTVDPILRKAYNEALGR